jgi:hypothetical protein
MLLNTNCFEFKIISDLRALLKLVEADAARGRLCAPAAAALAAGPRPGACLATAAAAGAAAAVPRLQPLMVCAAAAAAAALLRWERSSVIACKR